LLARARLGLSLAGIAGGALAGCGGTTATSHTPIQVAAANGTVTLARVPSRIVSLSATGTEDLYAVGAGKQVVAVDSYSTYPPQAPRTSLSETAPNVEAIAKYRPDLVVVADDSNHIIRQLAKLGVPVLVEPPATNLDGVYAELGQLAEATGHPGAAAPIVAGTRRQVTAIVSSVPKPTRALSVYHELDQTFFSATSQTFIGQMYSLLGLRNIADKARTASSYPKLSAEYVVRANPDLIVLADTVCCGQTRTSVAARPGWRNIAAVENGHILPVDDSVASEWGPRIVLFLKTVADRVRTLGGRSG
jgi:iron complex transport system substrate-binding protein